LSIQVIRSTVTTALVTWATPKDIPVVRESQYFDKPEDNGTFITISINPADTIVADLSGESKRYLGEVMINIWVKDGQGTGEAEELAEEIVSLFPVVPRNYLPVCIETLPSLKRSVLDESGYRISPICFNYRLEA
jgi:hypothetical protein